MPVRGSSFFALAASVLLAPTALAETESAPWIRGSAGFTYLAGTYTWAEAGPEAPVDGMGVDLSLTAGYRVTPAYAFGLRGEAGAFTAGVSLDGTSASTPYRASLGLETALRAEELFASASVSACRVGWMSGSRDGISEAPEVARRMIGPCAAVAGGFYRGALAFEARVSYLSVSSGAELEAVLIGVAFVAQSW